MRSTRGCDTFRALQFDSGRNSRRSEHPFAVAFKTDTERNCLPNGKSHTYTGYVLKNVFNNCIAPYIRSAYIIHCDLDSTQVQEFYAQGPKEAFESTRLVFLPIASANAINSETAEQYTPAARGCLQLFNKSFD